MPGPRFQFVFGPEKLMEMHLLENSEARRTTIDMSNAPCAAAALGEPAAQNALKQWMLATRGLDQIGWDEVEAALVDLNVDVDKLVELFPKD